MVGGWVQHQGIGCDYVQICESTFRLRRSSCAVDFFCVARDAICATKKPAGAGGFVILVIFGL